MHLHWSSWCGSRTWLGELSCRKRATSIISCNRRWKELSLDSGHNPPHPFPPPPFSLFSTSHIHIPAQNLTCWNCCTVQAILFCMDWYFHSIPGMSCHGHSFKFWGPLFSLMCRSATCHPSPCFCLPLKESAACALLSSPLLSYLGQIAIILSGAVDRTWLLDTSSPDPDCRLAALLIATEQGSLAWGGIEKWREGVWVVGLKEYIL